MNVFPKVKECPNCRAINMVRLNGIAHENEFKSLHGWILKKIFNCRKCKIEMGLFIHPENKNEEKLVWIEHLKCEDLYYDQLNKLKKDKLKNKKQIKKYNETIKEISEIEDKIRSDQVKIKIKTKIENKRMLI